MSGVNPRKRQLEVSIVDIDNNNNTDNEKKDDDEDNNNIDKEIDKKHDDINDNDDGQESNYECVENIEKNLLEENHISNDKSNNSNVGDVDIDVKNANNDDTSIEISRDDFHLRRAMDIRGSPSTTILEVIELFPKEVQYKTKNGEYPLHKACEYGYNDVAMKLIDLFPKAVQQKNWNGLYPLHVACHNRTISEHVVIKLIEIFPSAAFELTKVGGRNPLHLACCSNQTQAVIKKLIEIHPLAIQIKDDCGRYPIHCALANDRPIALELVKLLLDSDPIAMQRKRRGRGQLCVNDDATPLHLACANNNRVNLVKYLMQRSDLQINIKDSAGMAPLHYACHYDNDKIVNVLLHHPDVDVNATDSLNDTPLHATLKYNRYRNPERVVHIIRKLLDHTCILSNEKNNNNETPLDLIKDRFDNFIIGCSWPIGMISIISRDRNIKYLECYNQIITLLEEFPVKTRWNAYCYHVKTLKDL